MFKFFGRVKTVVSSELNALLDKAEDPEKLLDQYLRDMEKDILEVEKAVAKQIATEKKFQKDVDELSALVTKRQQQAEKAVMAGNDDLAKRALEDKRNRETDLIGLTEAYESAKASAAQLRGQLLEMRDEFNNMKRHKETLKARAQSAKAQKNINQAMSGFGSDSSKKGFDRMADKVNQLEAEAEASAELRAGDRSLDDELAALETSSSVVDDELAALKAKMNK